MLPNVIAIVSILIAAASLVVSIKVYRRDSPRITIEITNPKYDCFFGDVQLDHETRTSISRISGIQCLINNLSPSEIEIIDVYLMIKHEKFRLIPNDIPCWENAPFLIPDYDNPKEMVPDVNSAIYYAETGLKTPYKIKAYSSFNGYALFYNFPARIKKQVFATLCVRTPFGVTRKKLKLLEYNDNFARQEWEEVQQFYKTREEKNYGATKENG